MTEPTTPDNSAIKVTLGTITIATGLTEDGERISGVYTTGELDYITQLGLLSFAEQMVKRVGTTDLGDTDTD